MPNAWASAINRRKTEGRILQRVNTGSEAKKRLTPNKDSMTLPPFAANLT
jgi:hypothetical protein